MRNHPNGRKDKAVNLPDRASRQEWWKQDRNSETPQMLPLLQISQKSKYVDSRTLECNEYLICKSAKSSFVQD